MKQGLRGQEAQRVGKKHGNRNSRKETLRRPRASAARPSPHRARCQEPADDGPSGQDIGTQHFIGRVDDPTDVANEVTAQRLTVWGGQVLALEPILVTLLLTEPHLEEGGTGEKLGRSLGFPGRRK